MSLVVRLVNFVPTQNPGLLLLVGEGILVTSQAGGFHEKVQKHHRCAYNPSIWEAGAGVQGTSWIVSGQSVLHDIHLK